VSDYYRDVPAEVLEKYHTFRQEYPLRQASIEGITWEYILAGHPSGQPLVVLPGGLGTAESSWRMLTQLDPHSYRLVCPSYPGQIGTMSDLADGLAKILQQEGISSAYVVGGAYGSMLAQVFIHRHMEMTNRLVLIHAYTPLPKRANSVDPTLRVLRLAPMFMVKNLLRSQMTGRLPVTPPPELLLIAAQIRETLETKLNRQAALNTYLRMADFDRQYFTFSDLENWPGKTLIILAEDDPTTTEELRNELQALYPGASLCLLKGSSQDNPLLETNEYVRVMEEFFAGKTDFGAEKEQSSEDDEPSQEV
jgi:pimeloyl-ACP methyl ester carboxylesterase